MYVKVSSPLSLFSEFLNYAKQVSYYGLKKIDQVAGSGHIRTLKDLAMLRVCDSTLFCILLSIYFPWLSPSRVFMLLAVFMETPPSSSSYIHR